MALPADFLNPQDYFRASVDFLVSHSWIYCNANTRFIEAGVLEKFSQDYIDYFMKISNNNLNKFPFLHECDNLDYDITSTALQSFRSTLRKLIPKDAYNLYNKDTNIDQNLSINKQRKVSNKKQHEILQLSKIIQKHCQETSLLLDFGSGLGYLCESLYNINKNWCILGLEADEYRVIAARQRLLQQIPEARESITYVQQLIEANAGNAIENHIAQYIFANDNNKMMLSKWAIIGLHACADLTITAIKIFFELANIKRLIIMPCCYHKLQQTSDGHFLHFPLSKALKKVVDETNAKVENYFNRPFLRLACQETNARWRNCTEVEHLSHGSQMFWRAVADAIIDHETEIISPLNKSQRPAAKVECDVKSFANFCQYYELKSKEMSKAKNSTQKMWNNGHENKFNEIIGRYGDVGPKLAEALTCLQTTLQKLCENIVLYDRLCYMQEFAESLPNLKLKVQYQKILDEKLSPRCYVLIAEKLEP